LRKERPVVLAVIPARGGSTGVPRKNLKNLGGKPLVAHSVEAALKAPGITHVLVSSDSDAILRAAALSPRVIRLKRPAALATDTAPMLPVYRHAVNEFERMSGRRVHWFVGLEPTTPLRLPSDIEGCLRRMRETGADAVESVKAAGENPYFVQVEPRKGSRVWVDQCKRSPVTRRQDAPVVWTLNGAVEVLTRRVVMDVDNIYDVRKLAVYPMPQSRSVDLDSETDFIVAEALLRASRRKKR
jgi:CMP-N,N'-diacetyllegionaminic acid synthase